jgi:hypothetical protein
MNKTYYDSVTRMEKAGVDSQYIQGWQCGYLLNPKREEQRLNEAYEAGYAKGADKDDTGYEAWIRQ